MIAELINQIIENKELKEQIIQNQKKQLNNYKLVNVEKKFLEIIENK